MENQENKKANVEVTELSKLPHTIKLYTCEDSIDFITTEIQVDSLSGFRPFIQSFGGQLMINRSDVLMSITGEMMYWATFYYSSGKMSLTIRMNALTEHQYNLVRASLHGKESVQFHQPTLLTMIDDLYFVLPDDATTYRLH